MSVLRRLYNVASGSVLVWSRDRRASADPVVEAELDRPTPRADPEDDPTPADPPDDDDPPAPPPAGPRPRRL